MRNFGFIQIPMSGHGICRTCARNDPAQSEKNFRECISKQGGTVKGTYRGAEASVECECPEGHKCFPQPNNIQQGQGMCLICSGKDSTQAEKNFRASITQQRGRVLGEYRGCHISVECECADGHKCSPYPTNIQQGQGMCSSCGLKSEPLCREILGKLLGCEFPKVKPSWLLWKNGRSLELDGYNEERKIAFEYQGTQHDTYNPHFHRNGPEDFESQQERDEFKARTCRERGVRLICVPCTYTYRDPEAMRKYIVAILEN